MLYDDFKTFKSIQLRFKKSKSGRCIVKKEEWISARSFLLSNTRQKTFLFNAQLRLFLFLNSRKAQKPQLAYQTIERKFTSLNSVDVERTTITKDEWKLVCLYKI